MSKKRDIEKILPGLINQRVSINDGRYIGTVTGRTMDFLDMKDVTREDGNFDYAFSFAFEWILKIKIVQ